MATTAQDRITRIRIRNVRAIEAVELRLGRPMTVLIGENGSGKSTILECLELLRKAAEPSFMAQLYQQHRGLQGLLRKGTTELSLGLDLEDAQGEQPPLRYDFTLSQQGAGAVVSHEGLLLGPMPGAGAPLKVLTRDLTKAQLFNQATRQLEALPQEALAQDQLVLSSFGRLPPQKALERLTTCLRGIETHLGFDTLAAWAAQSLQRPPTLRGSQMLMPADRLGLLGQNLASAWFALKNQDAALWNSTMDLVRLGLGQNIDSINTLPDAGGGNLSLFLKRSDLSEAIPAAYLSDGQLAWLSFVAMAKLNPKRSLLAVDEPELHLHPSLLGRVVSLLQNLPGAPPVVLSTHADRVLDLVEDPADAVRVCGLEDSKATLSHVDAEELPRWLEAYGDLSGLRAAGFLHRVLRPADAPPPLAEGAEA